MHDEPLQLLVGPGHPFADARTVAPAALAGHVIRMPSVVAGTEWGTYYGDLAAAFGLTIDTGGPNFGIEPLLELIARTPTVATLVGAQTRIACLTDHDLRRIALRDPTPVYPHSLVWRRDDPHPGLAALRDHLTARSAGPAAAIWLPAWAPPLPRPAASPGES